MQFDCAAHISRITALIPTGQEPIEYLRQCLDAHIEALSPAAAMGVVPASLLSPARLYASSRVTVEFLNDPVRLAARQEGIVDLGFIEWVLRPALQIARGRIEPPAGPPWNALSAGAVEAVANSVCRIDLAYNGSDPVQVGSGFVVGRAADDSLVVMTNAHVINQLERFGWLADESVQAVCGFLHEAAGPSVPAVRLSVRRRVHSRYDLALLYVEAEDALKAALGDLGLVAAARAPDPTVGRRIAVVGHPSFNSAFDPFPKQFGFGDAFGIKRMSPGFIRALENRAWRGNDVDVMLHDATTLSGSSGSCIVDLESLDVLGLHFGGWPLGRHRLSRGSIAGLFEANGAVPLWMLAGDSEMSGVSFR